MITKDPVDKLSGLLMRMELAYEGAVLVAPDSVPSDMQEILDNMRNILDVEIPQRLKEVPQPQEGPGLSDRKIRHELRNKMSVLMGFSDLLVYTGRAEGEFADRLTEIRELAEDFTAFL